jgi:hypothetical protein
MMCDIQVFNFENTPVQHNSTLVRVTCGLAPVEGQPFHFNAILWWDAIRAQH